MNAQSEHKGASIDAFESFLGTEDALKKLAQKAARANIARGLPAMIGGHYFYEIDESWEGRVLENDKQSFIAKSAWELEAGLEAQTFNTIFIPAAATITAKTARRICARHSGAKTIFFEHSGTDREYNTEFYGNGTNE